MIEKKKNYLAPEVKVVEIEQTEMICQSIKGGLTAPGGIGQGEDAEWSNEDLDW